jgi:hypothetical protein
MRGADLESPNIEKLSYGATCSMSHTIAGVLHASSGYTLPKMVLGSFCKTLLRPNCLLGGIVPSCPKITSYGKV